MSIYALAIPLLAGDLQESLEAWLDGLREELASRVGGEHVQGDLDACGTRFLISSSLL